MSKLFRVFPFAFTMLITTLAVVSLCAMVAVAQQVPASQPVATPDGQPGGLWAWCVANASWLVPLAIAFLSSLATGLSEYPKAGGVVKVLRLVLGCLSVVQFKDAPGSVKAPLTPPSKTVG